MTSLKKLSYYKIYLLIILFGIIVAFAYHAAQPPNNFRNSNLSDAKEYEKIYNHFQGNTDIYQVRFGIHNRIVIPYLAARLTGNSPESSFFIINTILAILSLLAIFYLMKSYNIKQPIIMLSLCYFSFHWVGPFRQNAISPINVDMAVYLFEALFLLLFIKRKYLGMLIAAPIAVATKEIFLAYLVVFLIVSLIWKFHFKDETKSIYWVFSILLVGIFTKLILGHYFPSVSPGINSVIVLLFHAREMVLHPDHLLRWCLGVFAAFGAFIFLMLRRGISISSIPRDHILLHILSLSALALSAFGGMDYTRLIFLGFPYLMISILLIGKPNNREFISAFILSMMLTRFWIVLPDPSTGLSLYNSWMPEYADATYLWIWIVVAFSFLSAMIISRKFMAIKNDSGRAS